MIGNQLGSFAAGEDIEELASDVFVALWQAGRTLQTEHLRGWLGRRALAGLSEEDRELFLRRYYYNQTAEQIAQEKHMNANTVRSRLARGRQALKAELQKGAIQIEDLCAESV